MRKVLSLLVAIVMVIGIIPMTAFAHGVDSGATNLALTEGTVAYAINHDGTVVEPTPGLDDTMLAECAIDGDLNNEAIPGAGTVHGWSLVVELPEAVEGVNTIHYHGSSVNQTPPNYSVWTTADGVTWQAVASVVELPGTRDANTYTLTENDKVITFSDRTVKAVKFVDDTNCNFMRVAELEIYADPDVDVLPNLALGKSATSYRVDDWFQIEAPQTGSYVQVTDGDKAQFIYAGAMRYSAHAYEVDLGEVYSDVNKVVTSFCGDGTHGVPKVYEVAVAGEDKVYKTVASYLDAENPAGITTTTHTFPNQDVRYVMVKSPSEVGGENPRAFYLSEIEAYADPEIDVKELVNLALAEGTEAWGVDAIVGGVIDHTAYAGYEGHVPELAINGSYDDEAIPGIGNHRWNLVVKLPEAVEGINAVKVYGTAVRQLPPNYSVAVSNDGVNWLTVNRTVRVQAPTAVDYNTMPDITVHFQPMTAQYVMFRDETRENFMRIAEMEIFVDENYVYDGLENYAFGKEVKLFHPDGVTELNYVGYESGTGYQPSNITDGNIGTVSVAAGSYQWQAEIDLGEVKQGINTAKVTFSDSENGTPLMFTVSTSEDGITWKNVADKAFPSVTEREREVTVTFADTNARYIRVADALAQEFNSAGDQIQMVIAEVEIYADPDVDVLANLAFGKPVALYNGKLESLEAPAGIEKVTDGSAVEYYYGSNGLYSFHAYEVDLGAEVENVNTVVASFFSDGTHGVPQDYEVAVAGEDKDWYTVASVLNAPNPSGVNTFKYEFPNKTVRYILVRSTSEVAGANARAMYMSEIEAYADPDVNIEEKVNLSLAEGTEAWGVDANTGAVIEPSDADAGARAELAINGNYGDEAVPGVGHNRWNLVVKLPEAVEGINTVKVIGTATRQLPPNYSVAVSNDGVNWLTVNRIVRVENPTAPTYNTMPDITVNFKPITAQYVMFCDDARVNFMRISEMEIYADPSYVYSGLDNYAFGKEVVLYDPSGTRELNYVSHESSTAYKANNITDGNIDTISVAAGSYQWQAQIDLGEVKQGVNTAKVTFGPDANNAVPLQFSVSVSENGVDWTKVATKAFESVEAREREVTLQFSNRNVQYIRVADDLAEEYNSTGDRIQMAIGEVEIYADPDVNIAPLPNAPAPSVTLVGTETAIVNGWAVESWKAGDTVNVFIVDNEEATSTATVNGAPYNSGEAIALVEGEIKVVVTTAKDGHETVINTYTITVPAATEEEPDPEPIPDATAPEVTLSGTASIEGWVVTEWTDDTNVVNVDVIDAEGFTSTITVNGYEYASGGEIVLTEEGTIEVVITTSAEGYNTVTNTYTITVPAKTVVEPEEPEEIGSEVYTIADGFIRNIPVGTTIGAFLENVTPTGSVKVYKTEAAPNPLGNSVALGTGMIVILLDADNKVIDTLTVVIVGDLSGDGKITTADLTLLNGNLNNSRSLSDAQMQAANLAQPTRLQINTQDLTFLKGALADTRTIEQR